MKFNIQVDQRQAKILTPKHFQILSENALEKDFEMTMQIDSPIKSKKFETKNFQKLSRRT